MVRTLPTVVCCSAAVLLFGCGQEKRTATVAKQSGPMVPLRQADPLTPEPVAPLESLGADAPFDASRRLFVFFNSELYQGRFYQEVKGPFLATYLHRAHVEEFIRRPGVGLGRGIIDPAERGAWIELLPASPGEMSPRRDEDQVGEVWYSPTTTDLVLRDGGRTKRQERVWLLHKRQLVSVNASRGPAVYLNSPRTQHELTKPDWNSAIVDKLRLDTFEKSALKKLRAGDEVVLWSDDRKLRMLGAIRARTDCLSCHGGQVGALLGAFTYTLDRQSEETPGSHKLKNFAGLTDRQRQAVRAIEAVGGKLIRPPGGPITEARMTFARNQETAERGRQSTRLLLRDSALPHLLAFPELTILDVSCSYVTDTGLKTIGKLKQLKRLDLSTTDATKTGVAELKLALPNCEVIANPVLPVP